MLCCSLRLSCLKSSSRAPISRVPGLQRYSSSLSASTSSVATILALQPAQEGQEPRRVTVAGSVRTIRKQKRHSFVEIGDGSTTRSLQAVLAPEQSEGLGTGTSIAFSGLWQLSPPGKEQVHELKVEEVRLIGPSDPETYPIQKKYHSAEYLRTLPHLRLRTPFNALLARLRSESDFQLATFFHDRQFIRLQPPIITSSDCEGAGEVFTVSSNTSPPTTNNDHRVSDSREGSYFRDAKFLTVSSQLHLEAFVHEHQKVWTLSPTFRAEKSDTPRHVSEFWMLEAEIRTEDLEDVMRLVEEMIRYLVTHLDSSKMSEELILVRHTQEDEGDEEANVNAEIIRRRWKGLSQMSWPRITYSEAMHRLQSAHESKEIQFKYAPSWSTGLQLEHEKFIAADVGQGTPIFVTNYPHEIKPFYMLPSETNSTDAIGTQKTVECFDLLLPEACEVVGGSLREHRLSQLTRSMYQRNMHVSSKVKGFEIAKKAASSPLAAFGNLEWYVDLRRYGSVPHGGFGLGLDRLLGYLAGVRNIKDVVPWPRYHGRCDC